MANNDGVVDVVVIEKEPGDADQVVEDIENQTVPCRPVVETGGTIPHAWNRGISRTKSDIILFTESDVRLPDTWAENMLLELEKRKGSVVLGYEVRLPDPVHNMASVGIHREDLLTFNNDYQITEDTEWFARLQENDVNLLKTWQVPPVFHFKDRQTLSRMFRHGVNRAEIWLEHEYETKSATGVTFRRVHRIMRELATLAGQGIGVLKHPVKLWRKIR